MARGNKCKRLREVEYRQEEKPTNFTNFHEGFLYGSVPNVRKLLIPALEHGASWTEGLERIFWRLFEKSMYYINVLRFE